MVQVGSPLMGRSTPMTWDKSKYVKLLLERKTGTQDKYLIALWTTANYYGWTEQFEVWRPKTIYESGGYKFCMDPGRTQASIHRAGKPHRVSRSPSTHGNPAGLVNQFKLSENCTLFDCAELAHFTKGDWYWLEGPHRERIKRDRWELIYQEKTSRKERGLVSV